MAIQCAEEIIPDITDHAYSRIQKCRQIRNDLRGNNEENQHLFEDDANWDGLLKLEYRALWDCPGGQGRGETFIWRLFGEKAPPSEPHEVWKSEVWENKRFE